MNISQKRNAGEILERGGLAQRIITIANEIVKGTYKEAIENAGRIAVLVDAATYDSYWEEKVNKGKLSEQGILEELIIGAINRDALICRVNPYIDTQEGKG